MIIGAGMLAVASFGAAFAPNMEVLNYGARVGAGLGALVCSSLRFSQTLLVFIKVKTKPLHFLP